MSNITLTPNTLPVFASGNERYADLPLHVMNTTTHECIHCGDKPIWNSYSEYYNHFYAEEWEGEQYHTPDEPELYDWLTSTCLA